MRNSVRQSVSRSSGACRPKRRAQIDGDTKPVQRTLVQTALVAGGGLDAGSGRGDPAIAMLVFFRGGGSGTGPAPTSDTPERWQIEPEPGYGDTVSKMFEGAAFPGYVARGVGSALSMVWCLSVFQSSGLRIALIAGIFLGRTDLAVAQTFFGDLGEGVTVGVDQGSTSLLPEVDATTGFLTFDTYGSSDVSRDIWSASPALARPADGGGPT